MSYDYRFSGIGRLYGKKELEQLRASHVLIVGIGGVGSWVAEAIARTGVGEVTLVDMDDVCLSNVNRQLHALDGNVGKPKIEAMAERMVAINPEIRIHCRLEFFTAKTMEEVFSTGYDGVIDCIDNVRNKCLLLNTALRRKIPVVTTGGAGGRQDPTRILVDDLARTYNDALLQQVRKTLRKEYGFPKDPKKKFRIPCVFSPEPVMYPAADGQVCAVRDPESSLKLDCESGYGTATFVTGTFGFMATGLLVSKMLTKKDAPGLPTGSV